MPHSYINIYSANAFFSGLKPKDNFALSWNHCKLLFAIAYHSVLHAIVVGLPIISQTVWPWMAWGSSFRAVVRVLAFHQCGPGLIPGSDVICGLSLLVLYSAPRGFSLRTRVFPSQQKPTSNLIWFVLIWFHVSPTSRASVLGYTHLRHK